MIIYTVTLLEGMILTILSAAVLIALYLLKNKIEIISPMDLIHGVIRITIQQNVMAIIITIISKLSTISTTITMITINKTSPPHNSINNPSQKYLTMANSKPQPKNVTMVLIVRTLIIVLIVIRQQHHRLLNGVRRRKQHHSLRLRLTVGAIMMLVILNPVEIYHLGWIIMHPLPPFTWMLQHYKPSLNYYAAIISSMPISKYHLKRYIH